MNDIILQQMVASDSDQGVPLAQRYFVTKGVSNPKPTDLLLDGGGTAKRGEDEETRHQRTFELLGVVASILALTSYIPITIDVFSHPDRYIAETTFIVYGIYIAANLLWLGYGIGHKSWAIVITSVIVIVVSLTILIYVVVFTYENVLRYASS